MWKASGYTPSAAFSLTFFSSLLFSLSCLCQKQNVCNNSSKDPERGKGSKRRLRRPDTSIQIRRKLEAKNPFRTVTSRWIQPPSSNFKKKRQFHFITINFSKLNDASDSSRLCLFIDIFVLIFLVGSSLRQLLQQSVLVVAPLRTAFSSLFFTLFITLNSKLLP